MVTSITVHPENYGVSPGQILKGRPPAIVNDDFLSSFADIIDIVNPLQHIPVVSTLYQSITGDTQSDGAKVAGGALFGGVLGFAASVVDSIVKAESGHDIGQHLLAALTGESWDREQEEEKQVASAEPAREAATKAYQQANQLM